MNSIIQVLEKISKYKKKLNKKTKDLDKRGLHNAHVKTL